MSEIDSLEWTECSESFEDILTNPRVILPQLIKLSSHFECPFTGGTLPEGQIVLIHEKKALAKLIATDEKGNDLRLPVQCPYNVKLKLLPENEKEFPKIIDVARAEPLPKFVEVTSVNEIDGVKVGDRLKVVIVEKSGSAPSFIHFRNSTGKHVKISVDQDISFKLAVNDSSEKLLVDLAAKSRELPLVVEFEHTKTLPKTYSNLGIVTITKGFTENVIIASAKLDSVELAFVFPLNSDFKFLINSKLKFAKDEQYRQLCTSYSSIDTVEVLTFLNVTNPYDNKTLYIIKNEKLKKLIENPDFDAGSQKEQTKNKNRFSLIKDKTVFKDIETPVLHIDTEQQEIVKKQQKELERQAKLEKERQKAEIKKQKKEKKEKEKEAKKKKKATKTSSTKTIELVVEEPVDEDMYIIPQSHTLPQSPQQASLPQSPQQYDHESIAEESDEEPHSQWAMQLMNKVKKVRDRTKSVGLQKKKRKPLKKTDAVTGSSDNLCDSNPSIYTGLNDDDDDAFSESLYETLPTEMAYESLDLIKHTQRNLAPTTVSTENSGDSGFDEIDQAKIKAWRESMVPPPLPGNHPMEKQNSVANEDIYEMAVDSSNFSNTQQRRGSQAAWLQFYNIVEQSAKEISSWDMEDVSNCLQDLKLGKYKHVFEDSMVDGQLLLDLDESVLRDLGLNFFEARKLRKYNFGWRPDLLRPSNYPELKGFECDDPAEWSQKDVHAHLTVIEINEFADFCLKNQVNGDLLKDICVDDIIMNSIITSKDKKIKIVKIKNYVIDKWRPKKSGEGNYVTANLRKTAPQKSLSMMESNSRPKDISSQGIQRSESTPAKSESASQRPRKTNRDTPLGVSKKPQFDAPLVARMKMQLEEKQTDWKKKQ